MVNVRARALSVMTALAVSIVPIAAAAATTSNSAQQSIADSYSDLVDAKRGNPENAGHNYRLLLEGPFADNPYLWGGAYVDGDDFAVIYVNQTEHEAQGVLDDFQIGPRSAVRLTEGTQSLAAYDHQMEVVEGLASSSPEIVVYGPQYSEARIAIGLDSDRAASTQLRSAEAQPPFDVAYYEVDVDAELQPETEVEAPDSASLASILALPPSRYYMGWPEMGPLRGGAHLSFREAYNVPGGFCSSGFIWRNRQNNISVISAAHCAYQFGETHDAAFRFHPVTGGQQWFSVGVARDKLSPESWT